ncbi:alpha/beta hydrolase [Pseudonocardia ailaonensis]|uniref:Alpha/beta hydrolase n=1 Tax=Pseudonocardia ailaonensis TaxID=367279 RepID=A0ABN2NGJ2_9PSEU
MRSGLASEYRRCGDLTLHTLTGPGAGTPAVLVHSPTSHAHSWLPVASRMSSRVLCPDMRGHGFSGWTRAGYRLRDYAADLERFCAGRRRVDLVAPSLGGRVAVLAAAALGDRVRRLVLLDSAPSLPASALARIGATRSATGRRTGFRSTAEVEEFWAAAHPTWTAEAVAVRARHLYRRNWAGIWVSRNDPEIGHLFGPVGAAEEPAVWAALAAVTARTVVVRARDSLLLDDATARRVADALPAGELREVPGGHYLPHEQPAAVATLLDELLTAST